MIVRKPGSAWARVLQGGILLALAAALAAAGPARASDEVDRIRDKFTELHRKVLEERYSNLAEGKDSNLERVLKDYDYLLKPGKNEAIEKDLAASSDPALTDRLQRLDQFLLWYRVQAPPLAGSFDNMTNYVKNNSVRVAGTGTALTLRSYPVLLANEADRSKRRNWYLASRELLDNANVFRLAVLTDEDKASREITGKPAPEFIREMYGLDPDVMTDLANRVLESTRSEYESLLTELAASELDGMTLKDLRAYDMPRLLRFASLDGSFPKGKETDAATRWLADLGIKLKDQRLLRINTDAVEGKSPRPAVFPIENEKNTRISLVELGGLPDYWNLFGALGMAEYYYNIDPSLPYAFRALGAPVGPETFGALFQAALQEPAWRAKYLKVKADDAERVGKALRFRQLHDLRLAAGHHLFQMKLHADPRISPSEYTSVMESAMLFSQTASEQSSYLEAEDAYRSGMALEAAVLAGQLREKLRAEFGPEWFTQREAGQWMQAQWAKGFTARPAALVESWGLTAMDAAALLGPAAGGDAAPALAPDEEVPAAGGATPATDAAPGTAPEAPQPSGQGTGGEAVSGND